VAREEVDESGIASGLLRHWIVAFIAFGACLAIGVAGAYLPEKKYRASATVLVSPTEDARFSGQAIQMANFVIPAYIDQVEGPDYRERARATLPPALQGVEVTVSAKVKREGSGLLSITVESTVPDATAAWANALADTLVADKVVPAEPAAPPPSGTATTTTTLPAPLSLLTSERASVPGTPVWPQQRPLLLAGAALGLFAAVFATRFADRLDANRNVVELIRRRLGLAVLAEVPSVWSWRRRQISVDRLLSSDHPHTLEAFKTLRVNVELALLDADQAVVAVVSSRAGEGKSTVAIGLASSLAFAGREAVVIDGDLRRPTLHRRTDQPLSPGVADSDPANTETHLRPTGIDRLTVLPAGVPTGHPSDVIATQLPKVLQAARRPGRVIIIDSPPFLVAEAVQLSVFAQRAVLVVRSSRFKIAELEKTADRLRASGVTVLGVVVNVTRQSRRSRKQYYGYQPATVGAHARVPSNGNGRGRGAPSGAGAEAKAHAAD
jgi:receptor protein-tyrosine kinase